MSRLIDCLNRCPICGSAPEIGDCFDLDKDNYARYEKHCYKLFCAGNGVHVSTGGWFKSKYKACRDWNRRTQDKQQVEEGREWMVSTAGRR